MDSKYNSPPSENLSELLESWKRVLKAQNRAKATWYNYGLHIASYIRWCEARGETPRIDRQLATDWVADLLASGKDPVTARARQLALRQFSAWMHEEPTIDYTDQLVGIKPPKIAEKLVHPLTETDVRLLLATCDRMLSLRDRRDVAIIRLLWGTGMRAGEVLALRIEDVNFGKEEIYIEKSKTGKGRKVPVDTKTIVAIETYMRLRRNHVLASLPTLWLGEHNQRLTYNGLWQSLADRAMLAGIEGFHLHKMRHTAATRWLEEGGSELGALAHFGWANLSTLRRYTRATAQDRAMDEARRLKLGEL